MSVPACAEEALGELAARAAALGAASGGNLLECFATVPDPRDPRGIRHSLACVLALCTAAVLCGNTAIEDVTAWVHAAPPRAKGTAGAIDTIDLQETRETITSQHSGRSGTEAQVLGL